LDDSKSLVYTNLFVWTGLAVTDVFRPAISSNDSPDGVLTFTSFQFSASLLLPETSLHSWPSFLSFLHTSVPSESESGETEGGGPTKRFKMLWIALASAAFVLLLITGILIGFWRYGRSEEASKVLEDSVETEFGEDPVAGDELDLDSNMNVNIPFGNSEDGDVFQDQWGQLQFDADESRLGFAE
jgi:hypothetical protein